MILKQLGLPYPQKENIREKRAQCLPPGVKSALCNPSFTGYQHMKELGKVKLNYIFNKFTVFVSHDCIQMLANHPKQKSNKINVIQIFRIW